MPQSDSQPLIKRKRVSRACDECRKKKVKCDSKQPCVHCTVYSYECTYNQPAKRGGGRSVELSGEEIGSLDKNRRGSTDDRTAATGGRRKMAHSKVKYLESKIAMFESVLDELFPGLVTEHTVDSFDVKTFKKLLGRCIHKDVDLNKIVEEYKLLVPSVEAEVIDRSGSQTLATGDEHGELLEDPQLGDENKEIKVMLPPKPVAIEFLKFVWENCCVLLRFYHRPTFIQKFNELYETDPKNYTSRQLRFLPLCYASMAVGALFYKSSIKAGKKGKWDGGREHAGPHQYDPKEQYSRDEGYKYYVAARKLVDLMNARELEDLQTLCMLAVFAQCSAKLSVAYSLISLAIKSALREGLHRRFTPKELKQYSPIEIEMRKRLFYTIFKLDVFVNTMLGLPRTISKADIDQEQPLELGDKCFTEEAIYPDRQQDLLSSVAVSNFHTKLTMIMDDIASKLYPVNKSSNTTISHSDISSLELKLRDWVDNLPPELVPGLKDVPERYISANKMLHLAFLHVQIILYRPFIHCFSKSMKTVNALTLQRAQNCISVALTIVRLAQEMVQRRMLLGTSWFGIYTIFFSVAALVYYMREVVPEDEKTLKEYEEVLESVRLGKNLLCQLKDSSFTASRIYSVMVILFQSPDLKVKINLAGASSDGNNTDDGILTESKNGLANTEGNKQKTSVPTVHGPSIPSLPTTLLLLNGEQKPASPGSAVLQQSITLLNGKQETDEYSDTIQDSFAKFMSMQQLQPSKYVEPSIQEENSYPEKGRSRYHVPDMVDQLDAQFFGRYLEPYISPTSSLPAFGHLEPASDKLPNTENNQ